MLICIAKQLFKWSNSCNTCVLLGWLHKKLFVIPGAAQIFGYSQGCTDILLFTAQGLHRFFYYSHGCSDILLFTGLPGLYRHLFIIPGAAQTFVHYSWGCTDICSLFLGLHRHLFVIPGVAQTFVRYSWGSTDICSLFLGLHRHFVIPRAPWLLFLIPSAAQTFCQFYIFMQFLAYFSFYF